VQTDAGAVLTYRPVFPDLVTVITDSDRPDVPVKLCEARLRELDGKHAWFWDVYDIRPGMESYKICTKDWIDVTAEFTGQPSEAYSGERYPFRYADGRAFLPFGFYHAAKTGRMWDSYSTTEMVEGTLNVGVLYTFLLHIVRNTAWKQRYTVDLEIGGAAWADENDDGNGRRSIVTDPATVTQFYSREDAHRPGNGDSVLQSRGRDRPTADRTVGRDDGPAENDRNHRPIRAPIGRDGWDQSSRSNEDERRPALRLCHRR
jgi:hypothetical protein